MDAKAAYSEGTSVAAASSRAAQTVGAPAAIAAAAAAAAVLGVEVDLLPTILQIDDGAVSLETSAKLISARV